MSGQLELWRNGQPNPENGVGRRKIRESIAREMRYLLTSDDRASGAYRITPAGLAHSMGVCLIEDSNMARGATKTGKGGSEQGLPRFVDVKLTAEDRLDFLRWEQRTDDVVGLLQALSDDGYRVGCSWSGEQQAYTVSLTGRGEGNPNKGLCMTSFAKTLENAMWLALFKHHVITRGAWMDSAYGGSEEFG